MASQNFLLRDLLTENFLEAESSASPLEPFLGGAMGTSSESMRLK
jgi:hypothetical protein